jgi:DNA-binding SARP family transcriptional activator/DNA-binding beta-propeller fold protein YncE
MLSREQRSPPASTAHGRGWMSTAVDVPMPQPHSSPEGPIAFGLLGLLEITAKGERLDLRAHKPRLLLAALLLHAGEVVSRDHLIEVLWDEPPRRAIGSLQNFVSDLRRTLGAEIVRTAKTGYALAIERDCVDIFRFERLLGDARTATSTEQRAAVLQCALSLWRGPPLADFEFEPFAQVEIARLNELRIEAQEELIDTELELGQHGKLIPDLEALVSVHPLRERLRAQLMLSLYRCGRQTEALEAYQKARKTLTVELGLEPGAELQKLERAILTHDPALHPPEAPAPPVVAAPSVLGSAHPVAGESAPAARRSSRISRSLAAGAAVGVLAVIAAVLVLSRRDGTPVSAVRPNSVAVIDTRTSQLLADVTVDPTPVAIASSPGAIWVACDEEGTVTRINPSTMRIASVIPIGSDVRDLASGFGAVWVAGGLSGAVTRIDADKSKVAATLPLSPDGKASLPVSLVAVGGKSVWAIRGDDTLIEIDPPTNKVVSQTAIPHSTGLTAGFGAAWVVTESQQLLKVIPKQQQPIAMSIDLLSEGLSPTVGAGSVWVIVYKGTGEVWRIDPSSGAINITPRVGRYPLDLAVAGQGAAAWVVDLAGSVLQLNPEIDLAVAKIRTAPTPHSAITVVSGSVWVAVQD